MGASGLVARELGQGAPRDAGPSPLRPLSLMQGPCSLCFCSVPVCHRDKKNSYLHKGRAELPPC